jgi:hypothetical protein
VFIMEEDGKLASCIISCLFNMHTCMSIYTFSF